MQADKKRFLPLIAIFTLVFALLSAFMLFNMFNRDSSDSVLNIFKRQDSYIEVLENEFKVDIKAEKPLDVLQEIGYEGIVIPQKYNQYYKPCFDFIITNEGIKITRGLAKEFYEYGLTVGDVIQKIGDKNLSDIDYFDIFDLLYSKDNEAKKSFTLTNGKVIEYQYGVLHNRVEVSEIENELILKLYDLDVTSQNYVYELMNKKDYAKITLDITQATITTYNSFYQYLSLFAEGKEAVFAKPEGVNALSMHKINQNVEVLVGDNADLGINFLQTSIKRLNTNVLVSGGFECANYFLSTTYQDSKYQVHLFNSELIAIGSKLNDGVEI